MIYSIHCQKLIGTVACKKTRHLVNLPYKPGISKYGFWALKVLPPPWSTGSRSVRLEASKKVLLVHMPQWAAKLQAVKLFSFFKNCTFLFMYHIFIWNQRHLWTLLIFWNTKTLTACDFAAPWGIWKSSTFLKPQISNCLEPGGHEGGRTFRAQKP